MSQATSERIQSQQRITTEGKARPQDVCCSRDAADFQRAMDKKREPIKKPQDQDKRPHSAQQENQNQTATSHTSIQPNIQPNYGARILAGMTSNISGIQNTSLDVAGMARHIDAELLQLPNKIEINLGQFIEDTAVVISEGKIQFEASPESAAILRDHLDELKRELRKYGAIEIKEKTDTGSQDARDESRNKDLYTALREEEVGV